MQIKAITTREVRAKQAISRGQIRGGATKILFRTDEITLKTLMVMRGPLTYITRVEIDDKLVKSLEV